MAKEIYPASKNGRGLGGIALLLLLTLVGGCGKRDAPPPLANITTGDSVMLDKHAFACKQPSNEMELIAATNGRARDDLLTRIGRQEGCYDTTKFLVNSEWQVLAVNGTQLHIQMRGYPGEYWVSRAQASLGDKRAKTGPVAPKASIPVALVTVDEWRRSLGAAYEQTQVKNPDDGVTTFMAMFPKKEGAVGAFGKHDAFNKAYVFKPFDTQINWDLGPNVRCYVIVPEGASPFMVVSPLYWGRDGYISLRKLAILVDGELVFEKVLQATDVIRGRYGAGVNETASVLLSGEELLPFRKITKESTIAIRLIGDRTYINLKRDGIDPISTFRNSVIDSLFIYDSIKRTTGEHLPDRKQIQP